MVTACSLAHLSTSHLSTVHKMTSVCCFKKLFTFLMEVQQKILMIHTENAVFSDLSTKLVESIVDEEFCTMGQVTVGISSANTSEYNSRRRTCVVPVVVVLCLVDSHNGLKCHQHQNDNVILYKHRAQYTASLDIIPVMVQKNCCVFKM